MNAKMNKESLAKKVARYITSSKEFTLKELYEEFGEDSVYGYKNHTVRARLYESKEYKEKHIIKTAKGVYALCGVEVEAIVEQVDTREGVYHLVDASLTYDLIVCDSPYATSAQRGGNRQLSHFDFITPEEFGDILVQAEKLLKDEHSQFIMMISGGKSGRREVEKYLRMFNKTNLKLSNRGAYTKYNKNGTVCNMGAYTMPPEQVLSFSLSGEERQDIDTSASTDYHFERPPLPRSGGYSTQKPIGLMEAIIKRATKEGEKVLDLFAGSGSTLHAGLNLKRRVHGLEISSNAIKNYILPMMKNFTLVKEVALITPRQTNLFDFI